MAPVSTIHRPHRSPAVERSGRGREPEHVPEADPEASGWWRWLLFGIAAAWASGFVLPCTFRWFLAVLPHEMGHATIGCLLGRPSAPAISLAGHAWTGVADRSTWLVAVIALALAGAAVAARHRRAMAALLAIAAVLVPVLACTDGAEIAIAASGHLGELAFATYVDLWIPRKG